MHKRSVMHSRLFHILGQKPRRIRLSRVENSVESVKHPGEYSLRHVILHDYKGYSVYNMHKISVCSST